MRNPIFKSVLILTCIVLAMPGCKKDQSFEQPISGDNQITVLVDQSWNQMASENLFPENPSLGIEMLNEGIAADFLLDASFIEETPPVNTENPANWYSIRDRSLIQCLRGLQLTDEQIGLISQDLGTYEICKTDAIQRARAIYRELRAEYHQKFLRLLSAYRNGTLTEREFKQKVAELRTGFRHELLRLHLRERLDQYLKLCFRGFAEELHGILTGRQWNSFIECYLGM